MHRAVAEVNLAAIERNAARLRSGLGHGTRLCAVVKADGYGHGAAQAARAAVCGGAERLAVATAEEAVSLREAGLRESLLVLGAMGEEELAYAVEADCAVTVWDLSFVDVLAAAAERAGKQLLVHVKLDSGLGRLGTRDPGEALEIARAVRAAGPRLKLSGAMTHFATAESDQEFVAHQLGIFTPFATRMRQLAGDCDDFVVHACNSAATLLSPEAHFDMVRTGIALYGCDPMNVNPAEHGLEPALALRSYVAAVKTARPGDSVGYGRRFIARQSTMVATLPIGYGDGLPRRLADNLDLLIGGRRYPLCGMLSMDNITVDLGSDTEITVGAPATIIGVDGGLQQTAEQLAARLGTINYEVLCSISGRVRRSYHRDGAPV